MKLAKEIAKEAEKKYSDYGDRDVLIATSEEWEAIIAAKLEPIRKALAELLKEHVELVASGDCGSWNVEEEEAVISAQSALVMLSEDDTK